MSISSTNNNLTAILASQYYTSLNVTSHTKHNSSDSSSADNSIKGVSSANSDGDIFQLSAVKNTLLSASDVYSKMDIDGDGSVSESEFTAARPDDVTEEMAENLYSSFDTDSSGVVTAAEFAKAMSSKNQVTSTNSSTISDIYNQMDTDGDGSVSESEFVAARPDDVTEKMAENLYSSFDTDNSRTLTVTELETAMENNPSSTENASSSSDERSNQAYLMTAMAMPFSPLLYMDNAAAKVASNNSSTTTNSSIAAAAKV